MSVQAMQLFDKRKGGLEKARNHAVRALEIAKAMVITTPEEYQEAGDRLLVAKSREELINDVRQEIVVPIGRAHRHMSGEFKKSTDAWREVWKEIHKKRCEYDNALILAQRKREREVLELQREQADKERDSAEVEAEDALERGEMELAQELRAEAQKPFVPIPVVPQTAPKTEGLQSRKLYKARVVDLVKVPMSFCKKVPDMATLHGLARTACKRFEGDAEKATAEAPPGVEFYVDTTPAKV